MSIEKIETYINRNGLPIMRRCFNCKHWAGGIMMENQKIGYCKLTALYFALTMEPTVFPMTKDFYLCENHEFINEEKLSKVCEKVLMKEHLKKKGDII